MGIGIMIVGYTIGAFLIAFGLAVLYEFSLEHLQPSRLFTILL